MEAHRSITVHPKDCKSRIWPEVLSVDVSDDNLRLTASLMPSWRYHRHLAEVKTVLFKPQKAFDGYGLAQGN
jgi:hypothetical protein